MQALRLAASYISDIENSNSDQQDPEQVAARRSTMALATKQLDIAMRADPTVDFEEDSKDGSIVMTQARMRATLLCYEGLSYMVDKPGKCTALLKRATEVDPEFSFAHYVLGQHYFEHRQKAAAIASLEQALLLDPDDMDSIKALDRARNMSGLETVTFKASRAAETTMAAGIKTYNGFVFVTNIFIRAWNVFAFVWNVVTFPFRIMLRLFGLVDRVWK